MVEQPSGTVTLVFTDIEGSTRLLHELGQDSYREALTEHRRIVRTAFARHAGYEVDYEGDAFFYTFASVGSAVQAVQEAMESLAEGPIRIRVGVHTGEPGLDPPKYVGLDVHRAARIMAAGHGGQVLLSESTQGLVEVEVRDLGLHRLKDLSAPQRLYQLGEGEFPPLRSLNNTNLPTPASSFLGRESELDQAARMLEGCRLMTVSGPGGTGKTRFAIELASRQLARFPQGVWWVPLAALSEPALVLPTAAQVLGAKRDLAEHIADSRMLVVFDNFEQVVEAASGLGELLVACPKLDLIVTSREPLHLAGEHEYPLPPFVHAEAIEFFQSKAQAVRPDFEAGGVVSEICRRLDDLPLALELAAARVKALSPGQILDRLEQRLPLLTGGARDLPERQQTLRARSTGATTC